MPLDQAGVYRRDELVTKLSECVGYLKAARECLEQQSGIGAEMYIKVLNDMVFEEIDKLKKKNIKQ